ncbi:aminopeptidase P N-terminal domain-containing protein [Brevibacillus brevis]|uniref:aminopeptidase P N-terminal domain-containing protein n=1 Tax=Brevibacillus brevis TaxID=1393 RepID=UPI001C8DAE92|nr:aminopeptidase P N-terminal domain-containing protein [Brevibacillus brevis]MBY0084069.1 aminopeptidase P N-terminal domain-containing protein [Brevibacillus brevis]
MTNTIHSIEFTKRRQKLAEKMPDHSALVLFSGVVKTRSNDDKYLFSPNRNFYYLTGIARSNLILMITKRAGIVNETLFLQRPNELEAKWTGAVLSDQEAKEQSGIEHFDYLDEWLESFGVFVRRCEGKSSLYLDLNRYQWSDELTPADNFAEDAQKKYRTLQIHDAGPWLKELRMLKSSAEIEEIRRAITITDEAIRRMWSYARPGIMEYELEAHYDFTLKSHGVRELPYLPIIASGVNATILHYEANNQRAVDGDLVLLDLGAASNYYAADISRTFPVNGRFTERQKAIYQLVLEAEIKTIEAVKPGVTLSELNDVTKQVLTDGLLRLGLIQDSSELSKYYYHSVSHHLGLDTHDFSDYNVGLQPGMVITIEPGLYIEEEAIGIRIEDNVLVTAEGCEILSSQIPKEIEEVEMLIGKKE